MKNIIEHGEQICGDIETFLKVDLTEDEVDTLEHLKVAAESCIEAAELTKSTFTLAELQRDLNTIDSALLKFVKDA